MSSKFGLNMNLTETHPICSSTYLNSLLMFVNNHQLIDCHFAVVELALKITDSYQLQFVNKLARKDPGNIIEQIWS